MMEKQEARGTDVGKVRGGDDRVHLSMGRRFARRGGATNTSGLGARLFSSRPAGRRAVITSGLSPLELG